MGQRVLFKKKNQMKQTTREKKNRKKKQNMWQIKSATQRNETM